MGTLFYGAGALAILVDDVTLEHLRAVITSKLRRREGFLISWTDAQEVGGGRSSVWVHPGVDLHYKFDGGRPPQIDQATLSALTRAASSAGGLVLERASLRRDPRRPIRRGDDLAD